jgi:hypothetical protein
MAIASTVESLPGENPSPTRGVGLVAIATGIVGFSLLAAHPMGDAKTFADVLANEAANRGTDALVHGGFIVVLALQLVCYSVFSARLGLSRISTLAGLVLFAVGAAFLCGSMLLDGLVTPAIAARYVAKPDKIENARTLFVLIGTMVSFLMPIGLAFQSAAIACWGWTLTAGGSSRVIGFIGLSLGVVLIAALGVGTATLNPLALMAAIAATALWAILVGMLLLRRSP